MKYTIFGFNQEVALSFKSVAVVNGKEVAQRIDSTDLMILRWIVDFSPKMRRVYDGDAVFFWVEYSALLEDLPLLDIGRDALYRRLKKMAFFGILTHHCVKMGGTFSCYGFGDRYIDLLRKNEGSVQKSEGSVLTPSGSDEKSEQIIPLLNPSSKSSISILSENENLSNKGLTPTLRNQEETPPPVAVDPPTEDLSFDRFWGIYDKKVGKTKAISQFAKLKLSDLTEMFKVLSLYIESRPDKQYRPDPERFLRNRVWEDEIIKPNTKQQSNGSRPKEIQRETSTGGFKSTI